MAYVSLHNTLSLNLLPYTSSDSDHTHALSDWVPHLKLVLESRVYICKTWPRDRVYLDCPCCFAMIRLWNIIQNVIMTSLFCAPVIRSCIYAVSQNGGMYAKVETLHSWLQRLRLTFYSFSRKNIPCLIKSSEAG